MRVTLSNYQYGTLRYIASHDVHVDHLRTMNMTTIGSLVRHQLVARHGTRVQLTNEGLEYLEGYTKARPNLRKNENLEISKRVQDLLDIRRLHVVRRSNAA